MSVGEGEWGAATPAMSAAVRSNVMVFCRLVTSCIVVGKLPRLQIWPSFAIFRMFPGFAATSVNPPPVVEPKTRVRSCHSYRFQSLVAAGYVQWALIRRLV